MAKDVLITPASGIIEWYETAGNLEASIELDNSNNLNITGNVILGDAGADVVIGDGVTAANIVFEQGGAVYALATKTLTLGIANSFLSLAANITSGANVTGNVTAGNLITSGVITATGNISCGNLTATGTVTAANIDSVNADLAERYIADQDYTPGTVVVFGGEHEITQSQRYADTKIAGVVSTAPAYVMNSAAPGLAIALQGRVPCRVMGMIRKGDLITSSNTSGVATRLRPQDWVPGAVIGKALQDYHSDQPGVIEVVVGRL